MRRPTLTDPEIRLLEMLIDGRNTHEVAEQIGAEGRPGSERTVARVLASVVQKFGEQDSKLLMLDPGTARTARLIYLYLSWRDELRPEDPGPDPAAWPEQASEISQPRDGARVSSVFVAHGTLERLPLDHHAWLAIQIGGLLWPKEPQIVRPRWRMWIQERGPRESSFELCLLSVDAAGQGDIEEWLRRGRRSSHYPGLRSIPGDSSVLDCVHLIHEGTREISQASPASS